MALAATTLAMATLAATTTLGPGAAGGATGGAGRAGVKPAADDGAAKARAGASYAALPLSFEPNVGQTSTGVDYIARGEGYSLFLAPDQAVMSLERPSPAPPQAHGQAPAPAKVDPTVVGMQLVGAAAGARRSEGAALPGKVNYFVGSDPARWRKDVTTYGEVGFSGVYPGIDVRYHGTQGQLEYDFVVAPGADPAAIRLHMTGGGARIGANGDLVLSTPSGDLVQRKPVVYQEVGGARLPVEGGFVLRDGGDIGFALAPYDHTAALVIDPVLGYSTYLGGTANDFGFGIAVDPAGEVYLGGQTGSAVFPRGGACSTPPAPQLPSCDPDPKGTTPGAVQPVIGGGDDAYVLKMNATGDAVLFVTYLGGAHSDAGWDLALDAAGNAYLGGSTDSADDPGTVAVEAGFPTTANAYDTTCGTDGACNDVLPPNFFTDVVLPPTDPDNPGGTLPAVCPPATFPAGCATPPGPADNFLSKVSADGSTLLYSTYLGGSAAEANADQVPYAGQLGVAVRGTTAYLTAATYSADFPTTAKAFQPACVSCGDGIDDSYLAVLDTAQSGPAGLLYSTFVGGTGFDEAKGVDVDASGKAYITGTITGVDRSIGSTTFPVKNALTGNYLYSGQYHGNAYRGGYSDAFVTKVNPFVAAAAAPASSLVYSSFLGGGGNDEGWGVAVGKDAVANPPVYLTGFSASGHATHRQVTDPAHPNACDHGPGPFCDWATTPNPFFPTTPGTFKPRFSGRNTTDSGSTLFLDGDAYVVKVNGGGRRLAYSTFVGGPNADYGQSIAVDSLGQAYITGWTTCRSQDPAGTGGNLDPPPQFDPDGTPTGRNPGDPAATGVPDCPLNAGDPGGFPQVNPLAGHEKMNATNFDNHINDSPTGAFVTKLLPGGVDAAYSVLVDGPGFDRGFSIAVREKDQFGTPLPAPEAYITGRTGSNSKAVAGPDFSFPLTPGAYDVTYNGGGRDAFITKIVG